MAVAFKTGSATFITGGGPYTVSHNVTGSTDRYLAVGINLTSALTPTVSGVTYNSVSLTRVIGPYDPPSGIEATIWRLVAPATGTNNIAISATAYSNPLVAWGDWDGVDQTTPETTGTTDTGTGTSATSASNTVGSGGQAVGMVTTGYNGGPVTGGTGTTLIGQAWDNAATGSYIGLGYRTSTGTLAFNWSAGSSSSWELRSIILAASGGSGSTELPALTMPPMARAGWRR